MTKLYTFDQLTTAGHTLWVGGGPYLSIHITIAYNTTQHITIQYTSVNTMQYNSIQYNTTQKNSKIQPDGVFIFTMVINMLISVMNLIKLMQR